MNVLLARSAIGALQDGNLPAARALISSHLDAPHPHHREVLTATGLVRLWDGDPEAALSPLVQVAAGTGDELLLGPARDALVACRLSLGDADGAGEAAERAVAHAENSTPVIALAFRRGAGGEESGWMNNPPGGMFRPHPHAVAFAAGWRAVAARESADHVAFRLWQARARSAVHPLHAGSLISALVSDEAAPQPESIEPLTPREQAVLRALEGPLTLREIARELSLSPNTIKTHVRSVFVKLGVHERADAVAAVRERRRVAV